MLKMLYFIILQSKINKKIKLNRIENFYENNKKIKNILDKKLNAIIIKLSNQIYLFKD